MNSKLENMLKNFNQNQLREINDFLNSSKGKNIKNNLTNSDKERLMREFNKLDANEVRKKIGSLSNEDIMKIIRNL